VGIDRGKTFHQSDGDGEVPGRRHDENAVWHIAKDSAKQIGLEKLAPPLRPPLPRCGRRVGRARRLLGEQAEDGYTGLSSDVDLAIDDQWSDELVSIAEGVATSRLVAVVELVLQVGGVVGV
jgi:hypothetical protein